MSSADSVGKLLAAIANLIAEGLHILNLADKRQWGQDEYEQVRALSVVLDDAKKDFQFLSPLVNGQIYYETDRKCTFARHAALAILDHAAPSASCVTISLRRHPRKDFTAWS